MRKTPVTPYHEKKHRQEGGKQIKIDRLPVISYMDKESKVKAHIIGQEDFQNQLEDAPLLTEVIAQLNIP